MLLLSEEYCYFCSENRKSSGYDDICIEQFMEVYAKADA
jgi:hypothetical protein